MLRKKNNSDRFLVIKLLNISARKIEKVFFSVIINLLFRPMSMVKTKKAIINISKGLIFIILY